MATSIPAAGREVALRVTLGARSRKLPLHVACGLAASVRKAPRAGGGSFTTVKPSNHSITSTDVIAKFLSVRIRFEARDGGGHQVWCNPAAERSAARSGLVELRGIEPLTSAVRLQRSPI